MLQSGELALRLRADAGALVDADTAADYCEVATGTIRVWVKRGKLTIQEYRRGEWDVQPRAWYLLSDVLAIADARGVDLSSKRYPDDAAEHFALAESWHEGYASQHGYRSLRPI